MATTLPPPTLVPLVDGYGLSDLHDLLWLPASPSPPLELASVPERLSQFFTTYDVPAVAANDPADAVLAGGHAEEDVAMDVAKNTEEDTTEKRASDDEYDEPDESAITSQPQIRYIDLSKCPQFNVSTLDPPWGQSKFLVREEYLAFLADIGTELKTLKARGGSPRLRYFLTGQPGIGKSLLSVLGV
jgi:hypothetical protein